MPAPKPSAVTPQRRAIWVMIGLATAVHALRDRRLQETVLAGIIGLAAIAALARSNQDRAFARLAAWDRRLSGRYQREAQRLTHSAPPGP
jgi:hypothetical protein